MFFLAIRVIQRLADDERRTYLRDVEIVKEHLYVNDLLTEANTIDEAREIRIRLSNKTIFWFDLTIILHWIRTSSHLLKTYAANRVLEIKNLFDFSWVIP